ncbi:MAG: polyphosphate kinase 2 family protein [Planctomycetota bacterium]
MIHRKMLKAIQVKPGSKVDLDDYDPGLHVLPELEEFDKDELKAMASEKLRENVVELAAAQELLYASDVYSVLIVLQAMDAAGKDGTIKHVMSGVNPQGCQVFAFKKPSAEELDHDFLWRYWKALPERGRIGIFNRSYYEDVLVVKVHPEYLGKLPPGKIDESFWQKRYDDINRTERHLVRNGTVVLKFFLNVSKKEQKRRFLERLENPDKHWKFSAADLNERDYWDDYRRAFEDCFSATSTKWAPWHIIPADHKWAARTLVSGTIARAVKDLDLEPPPLTPVRK